MPRANNISVQNNFIKGLITEATGLTFPENACTDTDNCVFTRTGEVQRRLGFDFEDSFTGYTTTVSGSVIVSYLWRNVTDEGDISFVVIQIGNNLHFYKVSSTSALSDNKHATVIALSTFMPAGVTSVATLECQFSSGKGVLFVTNQRLNSFYVSYNLGTDALSTTAINIQIRDFEGDTTDALAVDARPTSTLAALTPAHRYNLENQGWITSTLTAWDTARTDMPSNSDVSHYFKNASEAFDFTTVDDRNVGNAPAPQGHFIYNIYNINRSSKVASAVDFTVDLNRVTTSVFYAGRVFYAGVKATGYSSKIFFTQIIEDATQYGKCYQANDPTSEKLFDLLPSDGGVIDLLDAGTIIKMVPVLNSLVVFATNGIWAISGSQGSGFTANDYFPNRISSVRNISHTSFVDVDGIPYWWNLEGIYTITLDPQTNALRVVSLSDQSIKTFYQDIPSESKQFVRGVYDPILKKIQWLYKSIESVSLEDKYVYDRLLDFNLVTQAFYGWSVSTANVKINSAVHIFGLSGSTERSQVINGVDTVKDGSNFVITFQSASGSAALNSTIKYYVTYIDGANTKVTFAENFKDTYLDWESFGAGQSYDSFFVTGYMVRGQGIKEFQNSYVSIFNKNDVETSFRIRGQWNYANTGNSGKWSTEQLYTIPAGDFDYVARRPKIRGTGTACQIRVRNNGVKPFHIIGWAAMESTNQWV